MRDGCGTQRFGQLADATLVEVWSDEDQTGRDIGARLQGEEKQFSLIADLLESVKLSRIFRQSDKALRAEDGGRQRTQKALESRSLHWRG